MISSAFDLERANFLQRAVEDTIKWCAPPEEPVGKRRSDLYWLVRLSAGSPPIDSADAADFLVTFQLSRWVSWNTRCTALAVNRFRETVLSDRDTLIHQFAVALGVCTHRGHLQTSAASKFAMFSKPGDDVFIWDQLATRSARVRDAYRTSTQPRALRGVRYYLDSNGVHSYAAYAEACGAALAEERTRLDFNHAVDQVMLQIKISSGSLIGINRGFVERRFLDKLMFGEGYWLRKRGTRTSD